MTMKFFFFLFLIVAAFATEKNKETQAKNFSSGLIKLRVFLDAETKVFCWEDPKDLILTGVKKSIEESLQQEGEAMSNSLFDCLSNWFGVSDEAKPFLKELMLPLSEHVAIERRDSLERTPLMIVTQFDAKKAVETLIRRGAKMEQIDATGQTALHYAASGEMSAANFFYKKDQKSIRKQETVTRL